MNQILEIRILILIFYRLSKNNPTTYPNILQVVQEYERAVIFRLGRNIFNFWDLP